MKRRAAVAALLPLLLAGFALAQGYDGGYSSGGYAAPPGYADTAPVGVDVNLLANSWQFESAAWGGATAGVTVFPGQPDPYGGSKASVLANPGGVAGHTEISAGFELPEGDTFTVSAWYKRLASAASIVGYLRVYNVPRANYAQSSYSISSISNVLSNPSNSTGVAGQVVPGGSDWYRLAGTLTVSALGLGWQAGDEIQVRLVPWSTSTDTDLFVQLAAVQFNAGPLAGYQEQP